MRNFSIRLSPRDRVALQALSRLTGLTEADLVRQCLAQYLPILKEKLNPRTPPPSADVEH